MLRLPPCHCDVNAIKLIWAHEKNFVALKNNKMTLQSVEILLGKRIEGITAEICKNCVEHVKQVENLYWKTDRIIDQKMDKLEINLGSNEDESDIGTDSDDDA